jgi:hypothetical protein
MLTSKKQPAPEKIPSRAVVAQLSQIKKTSHRSVPAIQPHASTLNHLR